MSELVSTIYRLEVASTLPMRAQGILAQLPTLGISQKPQLQIIDLYFLEGALAPDALQKLAEILICDPITERYAWTALHIPNSRPDSLPGRDAFPGSGVVEIALRPGVTDNVAGELVRAAQRLGIVGLTAVATGQRYVFQGLDPESIQQVAQRLLVNHTIQRFALGEIQPEFIHASQSVAEPERFPLLDLDEQGLLTLSKQRRLSLDSAEMAAIQDYFRRMGRQPTDAELETLAQTWSEHCVQKTFKALVDVQREGLPQGEGAMTEQFRVDSLINTYLRRATDEIAAPWVKSAFVDNAGVIAFDDEFDLSFKVETHNSPSALDPYGGALTGIVGVNRDPFGTGLGAKLIFNTDVFCFADPFFKNDLPIGPLEIIGTTRRTELRF